MVAAIDQISTAQASRDEVERSGFGRTLRAARLAHGVSLRELARRLHYSHSYVSKMEHGVKPPTLEFARKCDHVLRLDGHLAALVERPVPTERTAGPRPVQLPPAPAGFVGRTATLTALSAALLTGKEPGTVPLVVLDGPPGVGKTTLALRWAHENLARFPDGALFTDLRGHSPYGRPAQPGDVLADFATALGVPGQLPTSEAQRAALLRSLSCGRRLLMVLDNASDAPQVRSLLPSSTGCAVIVTSRRRLPGLTARDGATAIPVAPLTEPEAVALMRWTIGACRAQAEPDTVRLLARRCGALPLALRLLSGWAATNPEMSLADLAQEISGHTSLLDALDLDDDPHSAVRSVFSWSVRALDPVEARVFGLLGLHRCAVFDHTVAAGFSGLGEDQTTHVLRRLATAHLIEPVEAGKYRMHELLRAYAAELARTEPR